MGCLLGCTVKRGQIQVEKDVKTFFTNFFAYCGETSAWSGTCAKFNPRNLAPLKHHARLWSASFGWHVLQRKSYTRPSYAPRTLEPKAKALEVLGQKPFALQVTHSYTASNVNLHEWRQLEIVAWTDRSMAYKKTADRLIGPRNRGEDASDRSKKTWLV